MTGYEDILWEDYEYKVTLKTEWKNSQRLKELVIEIYDERYGWGTSATTDSCRNFTSIFLNCPNYLIQKIASNMVAFFLY